MNELTQYAKKLQQLVGQKADLEDELKIINSKIEEFQPKFVELMELHNMKNFEVNGIGKFYIHSSLYPRVNNKDELFTDLKTKGAGDLIKETINSNTLRAYVKECVENKNELPKGVDVFTKTAVRIRKSK